MEDKKVIINFSFDYDPEFGYTTQTYEVDKSEILETKNKIYITVYGKLEED